MMEQRTEGQHKEEKDKGKEEDMDKKDENSDFEFDTDCEDDEVMSLAPDTPELEGLADEADSLDSFSINSPTSTSELTIATNLELQEIINTLREPRAGSSRAAAAFVVIREWPADKLHPLMIREVLAVVFGGLDVRTLQSCRLVATVWNEEACRTLQEKWPATFLGDKSIGRYMAVYCHFADLDRPYPHAVYEFYGVNFSAANEVLSEFFKNYGWRMKSLVLQISGILFEKLKYILLNDTINLESLWLRTLPIGKDDPQVRVTLRKFPKIRKRRWESTLADSWYYDYEDDDDENESSNTGGEEAKSKARFTKGMRMREIEPSVNLGRLSEPEVRDRDPFFRNPFSPRGESFLRTRLRARALRVVRKLAQANTNADDNNEIPVVIDLEPESEPKEEEEKKVNIIRAIIHAIAKGSAVPDKEDPSTSEAAREEKETCKVNSSIRHLAIGTKDLCTTLNDRPTTKSSLAADYERKYAMMRDLFELLPNLSRVAISGQDEAIDSIHSRTMTRAMIKMPPDSFRVLTDIHFPVLMDDIFLQGLIDLNCRFLNDVELIFYKAVQGDLLTKFFTMIGRSLDKLSLTFSTGFQYPYSRKPLLGQKFQRMKELSLRRFRWDLRFLESMPFLEKLILKDVRISKSFPVNLRTLENMKVFRCEDENKPPRRIDSEVFSRICRAFPNLTELCFHGANNNCLRLLYFNLPYLTVLEMTGGTFTDSGITGIAVDVCADLRETLNYDNLDGDRLRKNLFIGNLTRIKVLKLESNRMGVISVIFGINKLQHLKSLYLKSNRINDRGIRKIGEVLGLSDSLLCLDVRNCHGITPAGMSNLRVALSGRNISVCPAIEDLAYQVSIRHRRLDRLEPGRLLRDDDPRAGTPGLARDICFACRPLPRSYSHRSLYTMNEYEEKEIEIEDDAQGQEGQLELGDGNLQDQEAGMLDDDDSN